MIPEEAVPRVTAGLRQAFGDFRGALVAHHQRQGTKHQVAAFIEL